ncbi:MAG TPA: hypothetical protein VFV52_11725 [Bacilli bacterium]|nr:hypothetical protein [Bacilli bacterium]
MSVRWFMELEEITVWLIPGILSVKWKRRNDDATRRPESKRVLL